jgi:NAD(P)-dependent dehydrogenase (short-subunit alcohol dehydrogenase family)
LLVQADFGEPRAAEELWQCAVAWKGRIDVTINNAAVMPQASVSDPDDVWRSAWKRALAVNVAAPADLIRYATTHYLESGGGVLITMSSWAAQRGSGDPHLIAYAASKASVAAVTKTIARAHARDNILGYCIAPGAVHTDMTVESARNQGGTKAVADALAMGELVPPDEIAELIAVLATGAHKHLSGATLDVNGATYIR